MTEHSFQMVDGEHSRVAIPYCTCGWVGESTHKKFLQLANEQFFNHVKADADE